MSQGALTQQQIMQIIAAQQTNTMWYTNTCTSTSGTTITTPYFGGGGGSGAVGNTVYQSGNVVGNLAYEDVVSMIRELYLGQKADIKLPDGSRFVLHADGSYEVLDKAQKIVYKASPVRAFNPYINASDQLEAFIKWAGSLNLTQDELLNLPVKAFIFWLITEAAMHDQHPEEADAQQLMLTMKPLQLPRCGFCGRFVGRRVAAQGFRYCSGDHFDRHRAKLSLVGV